MGERAVAMLLEVDPWVLDYREQYVRASDDLLAAIAQNPSEPVLRNKVFTLDFVVTYQSRQPMDFEYEVFNVKETRADASKESNQRRFAREREDARSLGWAWQCVVKEEMNAVAVLAAVRLMKWGGAFAYRDRQEEALKLATLVRKMNMGQSLDELLKMAAEKLHVTLDDAYQFFSMAVCFGFLAVDLNEGLGVHMPVHMRKL